MSYTACTTGGVQGDTMERNDRMETGIPLVIAHRGASQAAPENTLPAFEKAIQMGADALETDVQWTKDGVIVVSHDPDVDRLSNGSGRSNHSHFRN